MDAVEKAGRDFLLLQVLLNAEIAALVMVDRMVRTVQVRAGAIVLCRVHPVKPPVSIFRFQLSG
jgi:hypothetical protein